jgi:hypothetical protein
MLQGKVWQEYEESKKAGKSLKLPVKGETGEGKT